MGGSTASLGQSTGKEIQKINEEWEAKLRQEKSRMEQEHRISIHSLTQTHLQDLQLHQGAPESELVARRNEEIIDLRSQWKESEEKLKSWKKKAEDEHKQEEEDD